MNEITILYGYPGSGKSKRAEQITEGKKVFWTTQIDLFTSQFPFVGLTKDTEIVIIDECKTIAIPDLIQAFMKRFIKVEKPFKKTEFIDMPTVIFLVQIP